MNHYRKEYSDAGEDELEWYAELVAKLWVSNGSDEDEARQAAMTHARIQRFLKKWL